MKALQKSVLVAAAALATGATAAATATPAMATSTVGGCTTNVGVNAAGFNQADALCTTGTGRYQVKVIIIAGTTTILNGFIFLGPCVEVGQTSSVTYLRQGVGFYRPTAVLVENC